MRDYLLFAAVALAGGIPAPAAARIHEQTQDSFVVQLSVSVPANPEKTWDMLVRPAQWWDDVHSFSGDAANLSLHPRAGGCFCEILPNAAAASAAPRGSVEHMRIVYAEDGRALRMVGALGPMQSEAVNGVLTVVLKPTAAGTQIMWEYAVSGRLRKAEMAENVDRVLAGQIRRLAEKLGAAPVTAETADEPPVASGGATGDAPEAEDMRTGDLTAPPTAESQSEVAPAQPEEPRTPIIGR